jgi:hypothetical protein
MSTLNDGGPAFPVDHEFVNPQATFDEMRAACGMSLRDWFAGQVAPAFVTGALGAANVGRHQVAKDAYELADAMLAARALPAPPTAAAKETP